MDLLLKREQSKNLFGRVIFRLWVMSEMGEDEQALIDRYELADSRVLIGDDEKALKWAFALGLIATIVSGLVLFIDSHELKSVILSIPIGIAVGYWWMNEKRETIFLRDLIHGRRFKCRSIVDLAKKEAMIDDACGVLRQVLETSKHWDGLEKRPVPVLSKEAAKDVVLRLT